MPRSRSRGRRDDRRDRANQGRNRRSPTPPRRGRDDRRDRRDDPRDDRRDRDRRDPPPAKPPPKRKKTSSSSSSSSSKKKPERRKTIEELRKERKEREKNNTPEARLAAIQAKIKEDAQNVLADAAKAAEEAEKKRLADEAAAKAKAEEAKAAAKKAAAVKELRDALADVRMVGAEGDAGIMKLAKMRVAVAMQGAKDAGCSQEDIVAASVPATAAPAASTAPQNSTADGDKDEEAEKPSFQVGDRVRGKDSGKEGVVMEVDEDGDPTVKLDEEEEAKPRYGTEYEITEKFVEKPRFRVGDRVRGRDSGKEGVVTEVDEDGDPTVKLDEEEEAKPRYGLEYEITKKAKKPREKRLNRRKAMLMAVRAAAQKATMAGDLPQNVAKTAAATAKAEGAEPADVGKAAGWGLKIAAGETPKELEVNDPYDSVSASSSGSSSSSTVEEDEKAISEKDRAKANRDGMAAVFYFGVENQLHYAPAVVPGKVE